MWTAEEMLESTEQLIATARNIAETGEVVETIAFVFANLGPDSLTPDKSVTAVPLALFSDKDIFAAAVRQIVDVSEASGVFLITETWIVVCDLGVDPGEVVPESGSLADHPDHYEAIFGDLCTRDGDKVVQWMAKLHGEEGQPRQLDEFERTEIERGNNTGRFGDFFNHLESDPPTV